jgi:hypothetical protein
MDRPGPSYNQSRETPLRLGIRLPHERFVAYAGNRIVSAGKLTNTGDPCLDDRWKRGQPEGLLHEKAIMTG